MFSCKLLLLRGSVHPPRSSPRHLPLHPRQLSDWTRQLWDLCHRRHPHLEHHRSRRRHVHRRQDPVRPARVHPVAARAREQRGLGDTGRAVLRGWRLYWQRDRAHVGHVAAEWTTTEAHRGKLLPGYSKRRDVHTGRHQLIWHQVNKTSQISNLEKSRLKCLKTLNQFTSGILYFFRPPRAGLFSVKIRKKISSH